MHLMVKVYKPFLSTIENIDKKKHTVIVPKIQFLKSTLIIIKSIKLKNNENNYTNLVLTEKLRT